MVDHPATANDLTAYQTDNASRVFIKTMGKLAEQRIHHGKLEEIADELSSALRIGLSEINDLSVLTNEPEAKPSATTCPVAELAELRRKRKEELALLESQALKARGNASCASCRDQGESAGPIHPQAMCCDSRGEQR